MPIQDAIHGYIHLDELEEAVLDTPEMQRLRRVKQLGFNHLVYPSATHTRFEHSLGAMALAGTFAASLELDDDDRRDLRLAALLHDVGHGPFSHSSEAVFADAGYSHEAFSTRLVQDSTVTDILRDNGVDPDRVCSLIRGEGWLGTIIAGHIDVDRMDYLNRDAYYSGVAYGTIETETIIRAAALHDERLVFDARYLPSLESLLTARYLMIAPVYMHRVSMVADAMFRTALRMAVDTGELSVEELAAMDDPAVVSHLRHSDVDAAADLMRRLDTRDLYKPVRTAPLPDRSADDIGAELCEAAGLPEGAVLVDRIDMTGGDPYDVPLLDDGEIVSMADRSHLPAALQRSLQEQSELRVYAAPEDRDAVADAADAVL